MDERQRLEICALVHRILEAAFLEGSAYGDETEENRIESNKQDKRINTLLADFQDNLAEALR